MAIDNFYLADDQLQSSPSRKDGIEEATETTLRIYGCDLIQGSGILLNLPQDVMATGQVLFHRFYCKKSFAKFNVKKVAAGCVWLASKLEESATEAGQVITAFNRIECQRENLPIESLDESSKKFMDLRMELIKTERDILKELGFICHVEHSHKFLSFYFDALETPQELRQEAWNLANDSLRTTLCVRFKSEVVACGAVYAAARRFRVPLPESPPWWEAFDAEKSGVDEVCRVLARLYSLPKAQYISICKDGDFSFSVQAGQKVVDVDPLIKAALDKIKDDPVIKAAVNKLKDSKKRKVDRNRESDREKERDRDKTRDRGHRSKDRGPYAGHSRHNSSRDDDYYYYSSSSYSSREKDSGHLEKSRRNSCHHQGNATGIC